MHDAAASLQATEGLAEQKRQAIVKLKTAQAAHRVAVIKAKQDR